MKKIILVLLILMICGCTGKEKTLEEQILESKENLDREACLLLAVNALQETPDDPELYILKASCYAIVSAEEGIEPVYVRDQAFSLLQDALELDPDNTDLKEKIDDTWIEVSSSLSVIENLEDISFDEKKKREDAFRISKDNFWVEKEPPIDHQPPYFENNDGDIDIGGGKEMYYFTYFHDEEHERPYWTNRMYWENGHQYVAIYYIYPIYDHDYYPCTRKDIVLTDNRKYFSYAPHTIAGKPEFVQANSINVYEYDKNGDIVSSYAYVYENDQLTRLDHTVDYSPFQEKHCPFSRKFKKRK